MKTPSLAPRLTVALSCFVMIVGGRAASERLLSPNKLNAFFEAGVPTAANPTATAGQFASAGVNGYSLNLRPLKADGNPAEPGDAVTSMPLYAVGGNGRLRGAFGGSAYYRSVVQGAATRSETVLVNTTDDLGNPVPITTNLVRKTSFGAVQRPFPLRLIVHQDTNNTPLVRLLQRVFVGLRQNGTNEYGAVLASSEASLDGQNLSSARRISTAHLPWSDGNARWNFSGRLAPGGVLTASVLLNHDSHESNPFLHTYHPDHDNRDAEFSNTPLEQGLESYTIRRDITLTILPPGADFDSQTRGGSQLAGIYEETLTFAGRGTESKQYDVRGAFVLNRISDIGHLITD